MMNWGAINRYLGPMPRKIRNSTLSTIS